MQWRVNIDRLTKDATTQEHSQDEEEIALLVSQSIHKDAAQGMEISNKQTKEIEENSNLKIDDCV